LGGGLLFFTGGEYSLGQRGHRGFSFVEVMSLLGGVAIECFFEGLPFARGGGGRLFPGGSFPTWGGHVFVHGGGGG